MKIRSISPLLSLILLLTLVALACGGGGTAPTLAPTAAAVEPTLALPDTDTPEPAPTLEPSPTADVAATQKAEDFNSLLQTLDDKGYVSTTSGDLTELDPFKEEWAQLGWYQWWVFDGTYGDFVFKAHFNWSTAIATPEISGCGIVFGLQENQDHYAVFLDKSRILFLMGRGSNVYNVGKTRGSGRANFENPAEADFAVSIKGQSAYVSVNGEFTEYTLSADQTSKGTFGLTLLSGTNKDYGTRCEMTDILFWTPQ